MPTETPIKQTPSEQTPGTLETTTLDLQGMHCASCVMRIERSLKKVAGVTDASVNLATNRARVVFDPVVAAPASLIAAVEKAGYGATPAPKIRLSADKPGRDFALLNLIGAAVLTLPVLVVSMARMVQPSWVEWIFAALTTLVVFGFGRQFFEGAWSALRHGGAATMDTLVALGTDLGPSSVGLLRDGSDYCHTDSSGPLAGSPGKAAGVGHDPVFDRTFAENCETGYRERRRSGCPFGQLEPGRSAAGAPRREAGRRRYRHGRCLGGR
jgi:copper chaperone CopZ